MTLMKLIQTCPDIDQARVQGSENIKRSYEYKRRFDSIKTKVNNFAIGDFELFQNEERNQTKLDPKYKGPFRAINV